MKKLSLNLLFLFLGLSVALFITSCGTTDDGQKVPATVSLLDGEGFITDATTLDAGAKFKVQLNALPGEGDLKTLTIYQDNVEVETTRFTVSDANGDLTPNNPMLITGDDAKNGITWDIEIEAQDAGTATYDFEITDVNDSKASASIDISITETPLALTLNGESIVNGVPGQLQGLNVTATKGGAALSTIEVQMDGVTVSTLDDLRFLDVAATFTANPMDIPEANQDGFSGNIYVRPTDGSHDFKIIVTDANGNSESVTTTIIGGSVTTLTGVLLNSSGPQGTGGLDIDTGTGTGSDVAESELKDSGNISQTSKTWRQTIEPINGALLRSVTAAQVGDNFTFDGVNSAAAVQAAYDAGTDITVSSKVQIGDMFAVSANGKYYLLKTTNVVVTPSDNKDQYEFSIKF